jgi:hypothetical protein
VAPKGRNCGRILERIGVATSGNERDFAHDLEQEG